MAYHPRGKVKQILDAMQAHDHEAEWTLDELAAAGETEKLSVTSTLRCAVKHGLLFCERRGQANVYSLTPFETEEPVEFDASKFIDGTLQVWGAQQNEDGSISFTPEQAAQIKQLLA